MNASGNMKEAVTVDQLLGKSPAGKSHHDAQALLRRAEERRAERLKARGKTNGS